MRPETLKRRLEVLRQRAADARPMPPVPVVLCGEGESTEEARKRAGVDPGAFCVMVREVDASTPRPEATP